MQASPEVKPKAISKASLKASPQTDILFNLQARLTN